MTLQAASEPILDPAVVADLRRLDTPGRESVFAALATTFQTEAPTLVVAMRTAAAANNAPGLRMAAHSLKSAAATLGAIRLARLAAHLEAMGRAGSVEGAEVVLAVLEGHLAEVYAALAEQARRG